ncbi:MAG: hypothetical protein EOP83_19190, partial [Verrucomicrobiaceae bacterium]
MKAAVPLLALITSAHAGLSDPKGIWQLDVGFGGTLPSYTALNASTLNAGADYSFASDGTYQFLQTQPFNTPAKRLTVTNPTGPNGGPGATRTNQWTVVMDVKFDAFQPYSGILQLNPANSTDVSIYLFSANNLTATLNSNLSSAGAIAVNTWYRMAITCGNNGVGGATTMKFYLNGVPNGTPRTSTFDGGLSLQSTFHLFSDDGTGGDLKPAKLNSFEQVSWGPLAAGQHDAEDEVVPREDDREYQRDDDPRPRDGQRHLGEDLPARGPVDHGRLLQLHRRRLEIADH